MNRSLDDLPELSDLIVDFDPRTLERRDVARDAALSRFTAPAPASARRVLRQIPARGDALDRDVVDAILIRSHLELQRLHEEFRVAEMLRDLVAPMIDLVRDATGRRRVRLVDLGCGLGFVVRWLAARGGLGPDVELIGTDYNGVLLRAAQRLADEERLACRFVAGNAFALAEPADVVISTGVLHHFRGDDLTAVFARHQASAITGFVHVDVRPSLIAPLGAWIFHRARMREPLAQFDGVHSVVRAHRAATLGDAMARGAPAFTTGVVDAQPGLRGVLRIFQTAIGARGVTQAVLRGAWRRLGGRLTFV